MRPLCKLYYALCRRWGPRRMTFSAYAWAKFQETGNTFWRDRFDGLILFWRSERDHCQSQHKRETRANHDAKGPRP